MLVEGPSKSALKHEHEAGQPIQLTGRTMADHIVVFDGNERLTGHTVCVVIEEATAFTLFGKVVTEEQVGVETIASPLSIAPVLLSSPESRVRVELPVV